WPMSIGKWAVEGIETRAQLLDSDGLLCHLGIIDQGNAYYILKIESPAT
ncbi:phospholipid-binding lipoprotein MlaA, partial [Klebsiella pneumoniae]